MKAFLFLTAAFLSTFSFAQDFVEPGLTGVPQYADRIMPPSAGPFCIFRLDEGGNQVAQYCIDGAGKKHDLKGDVNAHQYFAGKKIVIDKNGNWVGNPTGLIGPEGEKGEKGDQGIEGPIGPRGEPGPMGALSYCRRSESLPSNGQNTLALEVSCLNEELLTGGGCGVVIGSVLATFPKTSETWQCNFSGSSILGAKAFAVCCGKNAGIL